MFDFKEEVYKRKDQLIKDLKILCSIPSIYDETTIQEGQPYGQACRNALDAMLTIGRRDGYLTYDEAGYAGHIDIGEGDECFGILGHLDVVPVNPVGWDSDPFQVDIRDDVLYGRGVADDKGPLLAAYYAAKIIDDLKLPTKMKVRVIFGCDEERGSSCVKHYFEKNPYPAMGFTPDATFPVVYGEKGMCSFHISGKVEKHGLVAMCAGNRANIVPESCEAVVEGNYKQFIESYTTFLKDNHVSGTVEEEGNCAKFILKGKSAHASLPEEGINAAVVLAKYLKTIVNNELIDFILTYLDDYHGQSLGIDYEGQMGQLTMNLGVLRYRKEECSIDLDLRCPHEIDLNQMAHDVNDICTKHHLQCTYNITQPLYVDPHSELISKLHQSYIDVTGDHSQPQAMGGGTYAKSMPNCVAFGCEFAGEDSKMHGNNENMKIDSLLKATEIYVKAIYDLIKA